MKTEIDNNQRVFWLKFHTINENLFCNLSDIPRIIRTQVHYGDDGAYYYPVRIYHLWNNNFYRMSIKDLNEMFEAHNIKFKIK